MDSKTGNKNVAEASFEYHKEKRRVKLIQLGNLIKNYHNKTTPIYKHNPSNVVGSDSK